MGLVKVYRTGEVDAAALQRALGEEPLWEQLARPVAPVIVVDGRVHSVSARFLERRAEYGLHQATLNRLAGALAQWLAYLINSCGLPYLPGRVDPVFSATEEHFAAYYRLRQYGPDASRLTGEGWGKQASAIKQFYEYTARTYQHPAPFKIISFQSRDGWSGTKIAGYRPARRRTSSAGTPLGPEFAEYLLMGALRVDLEGTQHPYHGAARDAAILALGLGAGLRRGTIAGITTYEIPARTDLLFPVMRVPGAITKGQAGGQALFFTHRLPVIHNYIESDRTQSKRRYAPTDPLMVITANATRVSYADSDGLVHERLWDDMDIDRRSRLVDTDGTTPILFRDVHTGRPLRWESYKHVVPAAAEFVRKHITPDFPDLRLHDLRHTYATHLAVAIYQGLVSDALRSRNRQADWVVDRVHEAVEMAKLSLGHASNKSTELYTQTAHRFLQIDPDAFLGRY